MVGLMVRDGKFRHGVPDAWVPREACLTIRDREQILLGLARGESMSAIARAIDLFPFLLWCGEEMAEHAGNRGRVDGDFSVVGIESISLSRGMCFGPCPVYQVIIQADGEARWRGEHFTERIGRFRGKVEPKDFRKIADYVERCGFYEWADEYRPSDFVTDNPEYRIRIATDGEAKEVLQYATDEPATFGRLAARIDKVAERIVWTEADPGSSALDP